MIGLSTYAYQWRMHESAADVWTVERVLEDAARLGVEVVQLCDVPELDAIARHGIGSEGRDRLSALHLRGDELGVQLEVGTKGVHPAHLSEFLEIAQQLGSTVLRSMVVTDRQRPNLSQAETMLRSVLPAFESAGVTIALETYEQVATADLVDVVSLINSPALGICLDPGNVVARLEYPLDVVNMTAPWVRNLHVKDFAFTRSPDMVGFRFAGCPLGEGMLDYAALIEAVQPEARGINSIIEQWVAWQGNSAATIALEKVWAEHAVRWIREQTLSASRSADLTPR